MDNVYNSIWEIVRKITSKDKFRVDLLVWAKIGNNCSRKVSGQIGVVSHSISDELEEEMSKWK